MKHHHNDPIIGNWYECKGLPEAFTVIDAEADNFVDIQYLDGELDHLEMDAWEAMDIEEIAEPEDAATAFGIYHEDRDIVNLLNEIEDQTELDEHLRNLDHEEDGWQ